MTNVKINRWYRTLEEYEARVCITDISGAIATYVFVSSDGSIITTQDASVSNFASFKQFYSNKEEE